MVSYFKSCEFYFCIPVLVCFLLKAICFSWLYPTQSFHSLHCFMTQSVTLIYGFIYAYYSHCMLLNQFVLSVLGFCEFSFLKPSLHTLFNFVNGHHTFF